MEEFQQGLRDLGYVEGRNIAIERRYSEGRNDRLPDLAAALVRLKVDIIVTFGTPAVQAARNVSSTIPIVFAVADDPVRSGLVATRIVGWGASPKAARSSPAKCNSTASLRLRVTSSSVAPWVTTGISRHSATYPDWSPGRITALIVR